MPLTKITTSGITNDAITSDKIASGTITTAKVAADAITTAKIAADAITTVKIANDAVSADKIASGTITTAKIADDAVTSGKIANDTIANADISSSAAIAYSKLNLATSIANADISSTAGITLNKISGNTSFKNIVINGDMRIAQRATSTASVTGGGYHTVDRWQTDLTTLGTWTQSQSSDVPSGYGFASSLKMDCTTADASPASGDVLAIQTHIEGQNLQYLKKGTANATSLTLSFWVKSTKTGTFIAEIYDGDNNRHIAKSYTVNTTNTWENKTITFEGDTTGAFTNDNGSSLLLIFYLGAGSNFTSGTLATTWASYTAANRAVGQVNAADSTANDWFITGVQLEAGTSASDFEFLTIDVSLNRCYRYFYKRISTDPYGPLAQGMQIGASDMMIQGYHPITMRASPTMAIGGSWHYEAGTGSGAWSIGSQRTNPTAWATQTTISNTDGSAAIIYGFGDTTANLTASAEL
jgi:hypothetical protein